MTDNEIIKALECCIYHHGKCTSCPLYAEVTTVCKEKKDNYVLDLINRQKAENESLKMDLAKCSIRIDNLYKTADEIKSEAIKEFVERLKTLILSQLTCSTMGKKEAYYLCLNEIDNLVKEMTEV